ncbi:hypothetical protein LbDm2_2257 [Levilactobacillus brevis]|uniref:hypothetical protein n=1 Tax=Levilactobacillus brevis TaxID=1580 RepID=UPI00057DD37D|nr:hypothetical protein [Levilactobacillus brevis]KID42859.1 hypothetical protein LbDm2_2257 [Levilactobacillus brevis]
MIDMRIGEYHITSEPRNYIVSLAKLSDDGTPKTVMTKAGEVLSERALGYYNTLPLALQAVAKDMMKRGDESVTTVEQYVQKARLADGVLAHCAWKYGLELEKQAQNI